MRVAESPAIGPLDSPPGLKHYDSIVLLGGLTTWASTKPGRNLHRSVAVYHRDSEEVSGPLIIDIDSDSMEGGTHEDAWPVAISTVSLLRGYGIQDEEMRLLDSGQKGYNIEVSPGVKIHGSQTDQETLRELVIQALRHTNGISDSTLNRVAPSVVIDSPKPYVRLWNSPNIWLDPSGRRREQLKREIPLSEVED